MTRCEYNKYSYEWGCICSIICNISADKAGMVTFPALELFRFSETFKVDELKYVTIFLYCYY